MPHQYRFLKDPAEIARAAQEEQQLLIESNRLMNWLRAIEGQFVLVRRTGYGGSNETEGARHFIPVVQHAGDLPNTARGTRR